MSVAAISTDAIAERLVGFVSHLRLNDFALGPAETFLALTSLDYVDVTDPALVRRSLKTILSGREEEWRRFDDLFEAFWLSRGRVRTTTRTVGAGGQQSRSGGLALWQDHLENSHRNAAAGPEAPAEDSSDHGRDGTGRLVASLREALAKTDLRHVVDPADMAAAEQLAADLAGAMRYRLSRRYRLAARGSRLDFRRTVRRNMSHGGDPIELVRRRRPEKPVRIVVLLDVSGSMQQYSRFFLQFVRGLVSAWMETDAYLFHTRLIRVTDTLRDNDPMRAMTKLALMAQGIGGGTKITESLRIFNDRYAKAALNSRTVVMIVSDGYDTGDAADMVREIARLKGRARRLVWLNPLLGWRDYAPTARAMAAALPHIDCFAAAHTLEALAAIEPELARL